MNDETAILDDQHLGNIGVVIVVNAEELVAFIFRDVQQHIEF